MWGRVSTSDLETTWYFPAAFPKTKLDVSKKTESNVFGETFGRFTANRTGCFCKTSGCFQLLLWRQNWIYIYQDLHIFSHISDINNIFFLTRRRDILSGVVATEQDIFNSICGDKTGHFLRDVWIFASSFVVTKTDIFITTSEHFLVLFVETEPGILNIMSRCFFVHKPDQMMKRHHTQFRTRTCAPSLVLFTLMTRSMERPICCVQMEGRTRSSKQFPQPDTTTSGGPNTAARRKGDHGSSLIL